VIERLEELSLFLDFSFLYFAASSKIVLFGQNSPVNELPDNIDHSLGVDSVFLKEVLILHS
jgi:hypothetical protein